jgi:hypothetical protein
MGVELSNEVRGTRVADAMASSLAMPCAVRRCRNYGCGAEREDQRETADQQREM